MHVIKKLTVKTKTLNDEVRGLDERERGGVRGAGQPPGRRGGQDLRTHAHRHPPLPSQTQGRVVQCAWTCFFLTK